MAKITKRVAVALWDELRVAEAINNVERNAASPSET